MSTSMPRFALHDNDDEAPHRFEVYDLSETDDALIADLAADVRSLYLDSDFDVVLEQAAQDLDGVSDAAAIQDLIQSAVESTIPAPGQRATEPWLDTARNELAEVICYAALEEVFEASVPAKRVQHKEIPRLMSRGMDAIALKDDPHVDHQLRLYLAETKASSSTQSPPAVVDRTSDSLHHQLREALKQRGKVTSELARALKYTSDAERAKVARALVLWGTGKLATTVVPFLLRPKDRHGADDFGAFRGEPSAFAPAQVAFCLVRIDTTIEALAQAVYEKARA